MRPRRRATMSGSTSCVVRTRPRTLMSMAAHQSSASTSQSGPMGPVTPALFTRRSIGPRVARRHSTASARWSRSVTSAVAAAAVPPSASISGPIRELVRRTGEQAHCGTGRGEAAGDVATDAPTTAGHEGHRPGQRPGRGVGHGPRRAGREGLVGVAHGADQGRVHGADSAGSPPSGHEHRLLNLGAAVGPVEHRLLRRSGPRGAQMTA